MAGLTPLKPETLALASAVRTGERSGLARAITLVESTRADHRAEAEALIEALLPMTGRAHRIGITGVPGVGKSTFIEALGLHLTAEGHRVAVLAVDPTSGRTGGSILGDKTRMTRLGAEGAAFIRPSPTAGTLGGVARATREAMLLCEAAGYDIVLVETVGVGQSETVVAEMTDFFLVLMLAGAGDDLQGIKKGILELADLIAVNKVDEAPAWAMARAVGDLKTALHITEARDARWSVPVLACSGLTGAGIAEIWATIRRHRSQGEASGAFAARRAEQQVKWMWSLIRERMMADFVAAPAVKAGLAAIEADVAAGRLSAGAAAGRLLALARAP